MSAPDPAPSALPEGMANPVYAALTGPHRHLARRHGVAARYPRDAVEFFALPDDPSEADWDDAAELLAVGESLFFVGAAPTAPRWHIEERVTAAVLRAPDGFGRLDEQVIEMTPGDVPEMLALVDQADGNVSFAPGALLVGDFWGIRDDGRLIAMGGLRFDGPAWTELSGGCVARDHRRRGLGERLLRHRAAVVVARGKAPVMNVLDRNPALEYFRRLGWQELARLPGVQLRRRA